MQKTLIDSQWIVFIAGSLVFVLVGPQERRFPQTMGGWMILVIALVVLLLMGVVGWVLYSLPTLSFIPPEQIVSGVTAGIPEPDSVSFKTPEQKALVERGRYLFTISTLVLRVLGVAGLRPLDSWTLSLPAASH